MSSRGFSDVGGVERKSKQRQCYNVKSSQHVCHLSGCSLWFTLTADLHLFSHIVKKCSTGDPFILGLVKTLLNYGGCLYCSPSLQSRPLKSGENLYHLYININIFNKYHFDHNLKNMDWLLMICNGRNCFCSESRSIWDLQGQMHPDTSETWCHYDDVNECVSVFK